MASAAAKSPAGSLMLSPPTVATYTSRPPSRAPVRRSRTASSSETRFDATPVLHPARCCRRVSAHQGLHLDRQGAASFQGHRPAPAGHRLRVRAEEQSTRVGHRPDARLVEVEAPHLVARTEPVLDAAKQAQPRVTVALEHHDDVDEVLQHPGTGNGPVLGHVPDEQHRRADLLGEADQGCGHPTNLAGAARRPVDPARGDRLDGVEHQQRRAHLLGVAEHLVEVTDGGKVEPVVHRVGSVGPLPHLGCGLLTGHVERRRRERPPRPPARASTCRPPARRPAAAPRRAPGRLPSTRSSSSMPVGMAAPSCESTSVMGRARSSAAPAAVRARSPTVPHASHPPQRPTQRGLVHPHSVHRNPRLDAFALAMVTDATRWVRHDPGAARDGASAARWGLRRWCPPSYARPSPRRREGTRCPAPQPGRRGW